METIQMVQVNKIKADVHNVRAEVKDETLDNLCSSITRLGIITPLILVRDGDEFVIVAGHRRYAAACRIGLSKVPAMIRDDKEAVVKEISFAENLFREDLSPVEMAASIKDCLDSEAMDIEQLSASLHRSQRWIIDQLALLEWPDDVLGAVHAKTLSVSAASNLACVDDEVYRGFLMKNAIESGVTARTTAAWLQAYRSMQPPAQAVEAEPLPPGQHTMPAVPQAPCLCCADVFRSDELSHVPICPRCIRAIRDMK